MAAFTSLDWWITVVLVSFVINLMSAYALRPLNLAAARVSRTVRWQVLKAMRREIRVARGISQDTGLFLYFAQAETRHRQKELGYLVFSAVAIVFGILVSVTPPIGTDLKWQIALNPRLLAMLLYLPAYIMSAYHNTKAANLRRIIDMSLRKRLCGD